MPWGQTGSQERLRYPAPTPTLEQPTCNFLKPSPDQKAGISRA